MSNRSRKTMQRASAIVGALVVVGLVALGPYLWSAADEGGILLRFRVRFPVVEHLHAGAPVKFLGVDAGRVERVSLAKADPGGPARLAELELFVAEPFIPYLTAETRARVAHASPLGEPHIELEPGSSTAPPLEDGATIYGEPAVGQRDVSLAFDRVRAAVPGVIEPVQVDVGPTLERVGALRERGTEAVVQIRASAQPLQGRPEALEARLDGVVNAARTLDVRDELEVVSDEVRALMRRGDSEVTRIADRTWEVRDEFSHAVGLFRGIGKKISVELRPLERMQVALAGASDSFARGFLNRRYSVAAFSADEEIQNDMKGITMDLKVRFWRFIFPGDGTTPKP